MNIESLRAWCLRKPGVTEDFPFDEEVLVFRVMGKIFALLNLSEADSINLKCEPEKAIELREEFEEVQPGYHMNKKHWNTVSLTGRLSQKQIQEMISHSYEQVVKGLPKKQKDKLAAF